MSNSDSPTQLLQQLTAGEPQAAGQLMPILYEELKVMAQKKLLKERRDHTLQPTALVNELFLKIVDQKQAKYRERAHFFAMAATMMRRILIDHARSKGRDKRGGDWKRVSMSTRIASTTDGGPVDLLEIEELLVGLEKLHSRQAKIVELRLFGELELKEIAQVLDVSESTVKLDWRTARAWLQAQLSG